MKHDSRLKPIRLAYIASAVAVSLFVPLSAAWIAGGLSGYRQGSAHTRPRLTSRQVELLELEITRLEPVADQQPTLEINP